jgi:hypothetical protein
VWFNEGNVAKAPPKKTVKKTEPAPLTPVDDDRDLMVDRDYGQPEPLDPNIASVHIHTRSNRLKDGYDLFMDASFGKERVTLTSPDFEIKVDFAISKANIELHFDNFLALPCRTLAAPKSQVMKCSPAVRLRPPNRRSWRG